MADSVNHEEALVKAFIPPHRQERFLEIIAKPKKRAKLLTELAHFKALNPQFMVTIPSNQRTPCAGKNTQGEGCRCHLLRHVGKPPIGRTGSGLGHCTQRDGRSSDGHAHLMRAGETPRPVPIQNLR